MGATTATRYRPLNLSAWEVRAIRDGRKTQTRRLVKPQPPDYLNGADIRVEIFYPTMIGRYEEYPGPATFGAYSLDGEWGLKCPFGQPGDHLWGRETWRPYWCDNLYACVQYKDGLKMKPDIQDENKAGRFVEMCDLSKDDNEPWRPSTQMPRWASRIDLLIKSVRIERLQEISEADAIAEGHEEYIPTPRYLVVDENGGTYDIAENYIHGIPNVGDEGHRGKITHIQRYISRTATTAVDAFREQWQYDNGPASWDANPWVWVIEHERITQ